MLEVCECSSDPLVEEVDGLAPSLMARLRISDSIFFLISFSPALNTFCAGVSVPFAFMGTAAREEGGDNKGKDTRDTR